MHNTLFHAQNELYFITIDQVLVVLETF